MIEMNDILVLKDQNPGFKFIYVVLGEHEFIFRTITRKEYRNIMSITTNDLDLEETVCTVSCMYPEGINFSNFTLAGLPSRLSKRILDESGFLTLEPIINCFEESRKKLKAYDMQLMLLIKAAFPEYNIEEIENWTFERLIDTACKAEYILNLKGHQIEITKHFEEFKQSIKEEDEKDKYEKAKELRLHGIDPMMFNRAMFTEKKPYVEMPIILGSNWQNEGVIDGIRKQMEKRKARAKIHRQSKAL